MVSDAVKMLHGANSASLYYHSRDAVRPTLGFTVATIEGRMRRVAAGELDEGNRLNDPHGVVEILLAGAVQDCQKRNGTKTLLQHAHA